MKNIFENAKCGDKFVTKNGTIIVFIRKAEWWNRKDYHFLCATDESDLWYNSKGILNNLRLKDDAESTSMDIVSKIDKKMKWNKISDIPQDSRRVLIAIKNELQDNPPAVTFDGLYHKPTNKFIILGLHDYVMLAWMEVPEYTENNED